MNWTEEDYKEFLARQGKTIDKPKKKPKLNNVWVTVDGHKFPSQLEANYYCDLKTRHRAGDIFGFCIQPKFLLIGSVFYVADFIIWNTDGTVEVIDTKGFETPEYKIKIKQFRELYPKIVHMEVR